MSLSIFMSLFKGRKDCYGFQQYCMKEPITEDIYKMHINGEKRIGVYPVCNETQNGPGKLACWIAADIDDNDFMKAIGVKRQAEHFGLKAYIERSKSKGYHIFLFFDGWIEAYKLRLVLKMILKILDFKCELFPKQDETNEGSFGNFINLPLFGGNIKDHKTIFVDEHNEPFISNIDELNKIELNSISIIEDIIETNNLTKEKEYDVVLENQIKSPIDNKGNIKPSPCVVKMLENGVKAGQRNEATFRISIYYKEKGHSKDEIIQLVTQWNQLNKESKTSADQQKREIKQVVESVFRGDYKSFSCGEGVLAEYCNEEECPVVQLHKRKKDIEEGIITLIHRDENIMIFRQRNYEYRVSNFDFKNSGKMRCSLTLSNYKEKKLIFKDVISLDFANARKRFIKAAKDESLEESLIKLHDLVLFQIETEEKEKLAKPKQPYIMTEQERDAAVKFLEATPDILYKVIDVTNRMGVVGEENLRLMVYLCFTSRIMMTPLSITVKGESSSGKSFSCQNIMKLIPEEGVHFVTRATQQALYHLPEDGLTHRIVYINELPGSEDSEYSIRSAQSEGDLVLMMPHKDMATGEMTTKTKTVKGPAGFLVTTTKAGGHDENETRNFSVFSDDHPRLTKSIGHITIRRALGEEFKISDEEINLWKNIQRLLNPDFKVIIPYAEEIFMAFPDKPVRIRRDRERFRVLIEVITILHQYHREQRKMSDTGKICLISTLADYYIAKMIAEELLSYTIYELGPAAEEIWDAVVDMQEKFNADPENFRNKAVFTFKYKDVADHMDWKVEKVKKWSYALIKIGLIEYADKAGSGGKGKTAVMKIPEYKSINISKDSLGFLPKISALVDKYKCSESLFYNPINGGKINLSTDESAPAGLLDNLDSDEEALQSV